MRGYRENLSGAKDSLVEEDIVHSPFGKVNRVAPCLRHKHVCVCVRACVRACVCVCV